MLAVMYRFQNWEIIWNRWFREPRPVPGDVRISTCRKCYRGVWNSQMKRWTGAAWFLWPTCGICQECQGYGPVD